MCINLFHRQPGVGCKSEFSLLNRSGKGRENHPQNKLSLPDYGSKAPKCFIPIKSKQILKYHGHTITSISGEMEAAGSESHNKVQSTFTYAKAELLISFKETNKIRSA